MKLIEDLGLRNIGSQGLKKRFGLYECPGCHKHFEYVTSDVKRGNITKCRRCANKATNDSKATKAASEFISKARAIHGDLYEYLLDDYVNNKTKIRIICKIHGIFEQTPNHHLGGCGCPSCAEYGFNKNKPAIVYYLKIAYNNTIAYKIGITNRTVQERFNTTDLEKIQVIKTWDYLLGAEAYKHEQQILKQYKDYKYTGAPLLSSGNTEMFTIDILELAI